MKSCSSIGANSSSGRQVHGDVADDLAELLDEFVYFRLLAIVCALLPRSDCSEAHLQVLQLAE
jgi:hypothetical protein